MSSKKSLDGPPHDKPARRESPPNIAGAGRLKTLQNAVYLAVLLVFEGTVISLCPSEGVGAYNNSDKKVSGGDDAPVEPDFRELVSAEYQTNRF